MSEPLPVKITRTGIWQRTLAFQEDIDSSSRDRLRNAFIKFRERAETLSKEISRDFPEFTVHDITHIDALWELADLVIGPEYLLTPAEAFVLGGAFLIHDLGMGLAAYPEGKEALYEKTIWKDTVAYLLKEKLGRFPTREEINNPIKEIREVATLEVLRDLHAERAEELVFVKWKDKEPNSTSYHLIEDPEIRNAYGPIIGKIACSHWWPVEKLSKQFTRVLGAASFVPHGWVVDPLKIACILRVADAIHLDGSRAPGFLKTIRKLSGNSKNHWKFQEKLNRPTIELDSLIFTSVCPFPIEDSESWFLCYRVLKMVDNELREIDTLFADKPTNRIKAKRVRGVDNFETMKELIPTKDWIPVDAFVKVSDVASLVQTLGGKQLYGNDYTVPLRELIQNSIDAIKARRILEDLEDDWGDITVRFGKDSEGQWIEVQDSGIGMSSNTLKGSLLDFGRSFWKSKEVCNEFPGLLAKGFAPIGKYGIGFFSVFIWGEHVKITTRRYTDGYDQSLVLEFKEGANSHPILRKANNEETLHDAGTRIRVWLKISPEVCFPYWNSPGKLCCFVAPCIDVNLYVEQEQGKRKKIISASDWISLSNADFIERLNLKTDRVEDLKTLSRNLRYLKDRYGNIIGRACIIKPKNILFTTSLYYSSFITIGGLRSSSRIDNVLGIFVGNPKNAARNEADLLSEDLAFSTWASEQAELISSEIYDDAEDLLECSKTIAFFGGDTKDLPVALSSEGWISFKEVSNLFKSQRNVFILDYETYNGTIYFNRGKIKFSKDVIELNKNVLVIKDDDKVRYFSRLYSLKGIRLYSELDIFKLTLEWIVIKSLSESWSVPADNLLSSMKTNSYIDREIGRKDHNSVISKVKVIENPNLKE